MSDDSRTGCDESSPTVGDTLARLDDQGALDTVFELLADQRRRHFLSVLDAHGETITLADAADEVTEREYDRPLSEISAEAVMEVYMSLYHSHIPKLDDAGVITYDQENDLVAPVPAEECEYTGALMTFIREAEHRVPP